MYIFLKGFLYYRGGRLRSTQYNLYIYKIETNKNNNILLKASYKNNIKFK